MLHYYYTCIYNARKFSNGTELESLMQELDCQWNRLTVEDIYSTKAENVFHKILKWLCLSILKYY